MAEAGQSGKKGLAKYVGRYVTAELTEGRKLCGVFFTFDSHMNMVLENCEEFRVVKAKRKSKEHVERKYLGLVLLRGKLLRSLSIEDAKASVINSERFPTTKPEDKIQPAPTSTGTSAPATKRLAAPARGVGAPAASQMAPEK